VAVFEAVAVGVAVGVLEIIWKWSSIVEIFHTVDLIFGVWGVRCARVMMRQCWRNIGRLTSWKVCVFCIYAVEKISFVELCRSRLFAEKWCLVCMVGIGIRMSDIFVRI
jgi:hypothetical protein